MKHDSRIFQRIREYFLKRKSRDEAHGFEREMEGDLFLYEAVEGLIEMHPYDIQAAMDDLENRVDRRMMRKAVFPWLKVAAGIAVVFAMAALLFFIIGSIDKKPNEKEVPQLSKPVELKPTHTAPKPVDPQKAPSGHYMNDSIMGVAHGFYNEFRRQPTPEETVVDEVAIALEEPKKSVVEKVTEKPKVVKEETTMVADAEADTSQPIAVQEAAMPRTQEKSDFGTEGREFSKTEPAAVTAPDVGYSSAKTEKKPSGATPQGGMPAYKQYLKTSVKKTDDMPSGSVVISFQFDKNGKPRKLQVEKSLCPSCDQEAMRAIESGISWIVEDRNERVQVEVLFP